MKGTEVLNPRRGVPQWGYDANTRLLKHNWRAGASQPSRSFDNMCGPGYTSCEQAVGTRAHSSRTRFVAHYDKHMRIVMSRSLPVLCLLARTNRRLAHHPSIVHCSCCLAGTVGSVRYSRYILRNVPDGKSGRGKPW